jgi:hypothetical protein
MVVTAEHREDFGPSSWDDGDDEGAGRLRGLVSGSTRR